MNDQIRRFRVGDVVRLKDREGDWTIRGRQVKPGVPTKYRLEREGIQAVAYHGDIMAGAACAAS